MGAGPGRSRCDRVAQELQISILLRSELAPLELLGWSYVAWMGVYYKLLGIGGNLRVRVVWVSEEITVAGGSPTVRRVAIGQPWFKSSAFTEGKLTIQQDERLTAR